MTDRDVTIRLVMSDIEAVSDRTARNLLKDLSKLCRRVTVREIDEVMNAGGLNRRARQSIRDRLAPQIQVAPVYNLKSAVAGSIEIVVVLTGVGAWLLQATVGETVKESWKKQRSTVRSSIISQGTKEMTK